MRKVYKSWEKNVKKEQTYLKKYLESRYENKETNRKIILNSRNEIYGH